MSFAKLSNACTQTSRCVQVQHVLLFFPRHSRAVLVQELRQLHQLHTAVDEKVPQATHLLAFCELLDV